jgi:hypothetical protein
MLKWPQHTILDTYLATLGRSNSKTNVGSTTELRGLSIEEQSCTEAHNCQLPYSVTLPLNPRINNPSRRMNSLDEDIGRPKHAHTSYRRTSCSPAPRSIEGSSEIALHRLPPIKPQHHASTPHDQYTHTYGSRQSFSPGRLRAPQQQLDSNSSIQLVQPLSTSTSHEPSSHSRSPFLPTTDGTSKYAHVAQPYGPGSRWHQTDQDSTSQGSTPPLPIAVLQDTTYSDFNYAANRYNSVNDHINPRIELQVSQRPSFSNIGTVSRKTPSTGSPGRLDISYPEQEHHYSQHVSAPGSFADSLQDFPQRPPPRDPPSAVPSHDSDVGQCLPSTSGSDNTRMTPSGKKSVSTHPHKV